MLSAPCLQLPFIVARQQDLGIRGQQAESNRLVSHVNVDHFRQHACHCILDVEYHYMAICMEVSWAVVMSALIMDDIRAPAWLTYYAPSEAAKMNRLSQLKAAKRTLPLVPFRDVTMQASCVRRSLISAENP